MNTFEDEEIPRHLPAGGKILYGDAMMSLPVIAIDGNAASGKGALARSLAKKLGFAHMDTGVLYRLVALRMLENGCAASDEKSAVSFARMIRRTSDHRHITEAKLKTDDVSEMTSWISAFAM